MKIATGLQDTVTLNNGVKMPVMGLGVWRSGSGQETRNAVRWALEAGYRSIDTAKVYQNEEDVGIGLAESGVPREEVFVTTKVWHTDQGYEATLKAFDVSMSKLGLETLDMYLIHAPMPTKFPETWRAMEKLYNEKRVRAIGVSNFLPEHFEKLKETSSIVPAVNQMEMHPYFQQRDALAYQQQHGIQTESWAPIAKGVVLEEPIVQALSEQYGKTPAQVVLRWGLQLGAVLIPKSVHKERIVENTGIFDFSLSEADMKQIDSLQSGKRWGRHPNEWTWD